MQLPFYSQTVKAGVPLRLPYGGRYFLLDDAGAARKVNITLELNGQSFRTMPDRTSGFAVPVPFDAVTFESDIDTVVSFFATLEPVRPGEKDGMPVSVPGGVEVKNADADAVPVKTPAGQPLEVNFAGVVNPVLGVVTVDNTDANPVPVQNQALTNLVHVAPVAVGVAATQLIADAVLRPTLKRLRIRNSHATAVVALGGPGVTMDNAAIQLQPGDVWIEEDAASADWYAISDTAETNVQIMGLK